MPITGKSLGIKICEALGIPKRSSRILIDITPNNVATITIEMPLDEADIPLVLDVAKECVLITRPAAE